MKFKYHYLENKLARVNPNNPEYSYQITEENQFTAKFGGNGFVLGESSWITFTIKSSQITVFYKKALDDGESVYYKRDFAKADIISFEFSEEDQVIKNEKGWWILKKESG